MGGFYEFLMNKAHLRIMKMTGDCGMALKIFSKAESFRNLPGVRWIIF